MISIIHIQINIKYKICFATTGQYLFPKLTISFKVLCTLGQRDSTTVRMLVIYVTQQHFTWSGKLINTDSCVEFRLIPKHSVCDPQTKANKRLMFMLFLYKKLHDIYWYILRNEIFCGSDYVSYEYSSIFELRYWF